MTDSDGTTLDQILLVLRRRWRIIVVCILLVGGSATAFSLGESPKYTASASLLFSNTQFDQELFGGSPISAPAIDPTRAAATNIDLVSLPVIALRTGAALHLPKALISAEVSVASAGQADIAQVAVTDPSPVRAAQIANTYAAQFVLFRQESDRAKIAGARELVNKQIAALPPAQASGSVGQALQNRANELGVMAALQTGNAEVVQQASVPAGPSAPNSKLNVALGCLVGLLLGVGLAFAADRLDRRVRDPAELEKSFGIPVVGSIPESVSYSVSGREALPVAEAGPFALLRARLRYFNVDRDLESLLVTSAQPGEGKTTVALNLAFAEAVAGNLSVALLEADLRRPALAKRLGLTGVPGVSEILSRNATLDDALFEVSVPGQADGLGAPASIWVITSGAIPPNATELVESHSMVELLAALCERFDLVIVDTPPMSVVPDALPLMRLASGTVIVSRIGMTTRDAVSQVRQQLEELEAPVLGLVANAVEVKRSDYYELGYEARSDVSGNGGAPHGIEQSPGVETL